MTNLEKEWVRFFESMQHENYTLAVTLTFVQWNQKERLNINLSIAKKTTQQFLKRLNIECYGHAAKRHRHTIGSVVVIGKNDQYGNIHLHMALTKPTNMDIKDFAFLIEKIAIRFDWIDREHRIEIYRDNVWLKYLIFHGPESLQLDCCFQAKP